MSERNEVVADLRLLFVHSQLPDGETYLVLDATKGKLPMTLTREQARIFAHTILVEFNDVDTA